MSTPPPETSAARNEAVTEERKMKPWGKPVIRHIGQTVYTGTGTKNKPNLAEFYSYVRTLS